MTTMPPGATPTAIRSVRRPNRAPVAHRSREPAGRRDARSPAFAAIDLGTNNCRLLIAEPEGRTFRVVDAFSRVVRLGEGLCLSSDLCTTAMDRTIASLRIIAGKVRRWDVAGCRMVATEACRRADNVAGFAQRVHASTGLTLEVISCEEEARLALMGCAPLLDPTIDYALVFDIGGGSTEVTWLCSACTKGRQPAILGSVSLPVGVLTVAESVERPDQVCEVYAEVVEQVIDGLQAFDDRFSISSEIAHGRVQMLGSSGTVTTLAGIVKGLRRYDRSVIDGSQLSVDAIRGVCDDIRSMPYDHRVAHPCIGRGRADLVIAGCAIVEGICRLWPAGPVRIADRGVREGILFDLLARWRADTAQ